MFYKTYIYLKYCYKLKSVNHFSPAGDAIYHYAEVESTQSIYHNCHTLEPDSAYQENPLQYEVPVPQQPIVHKNNEVGERETLWGLWDFA